MYVFVSVFPSQSLLNDCQVIRGHSTNAYFSFLPVMSTKTCEILTNGVAMASYNVGS